jgi:serine/threonine protein kinase
MTAPQQSGQISSAGRMSHSAIGRMTGAFSWIFGSISSRRFLRQQLWAWPILAAIILGVVGWLVDRHVESALREQRTNELNMMVNASVDAMRVWIGEQRTNIRLVTDDPRLIAPVQGLLKTSKDSKHSERQLVPAKEQEELRVLLKRKATLSSYVGYLVVAPTGVVIAADQDAPIGKGLNGYRKEIFDQAIAGKVDVSKPFRSPLLLLDEKGELRANLPSMYVSAPIYDESGQAIAALGLRIRPEDQFTRILRVFNFGDSGETYAFDQSGLLLSQSRFDDELKQLGLLVDQPDNRSILDVEVRDPQVNMHEGERPHHRRNDQPLTRLAASAVRGEDGCDADGYRDYRGVPAVGAWRWLPEEDIAIATEVDVAEAFRPVYILRRTFYALMGLLALSAIGIFLGMLYIAKQQKALQKATLAARQLGQYALEEKLGSGGMGTVYKARHAMLRRPTAIKLLEVDKISDTAIARFEREVQLTSALSHPNTVAVFDFGRTPEGIFYYAMEYLEGMNLEDIVKRYGPMPDARVVYVLKQLCGSLAEAHSLDLIHRDIKPANIFLTRRGHLYDFVKVLDFGLVKALDGNEQSNVTNPNALMGTPLYLSPEAINEPEKVDARADVYAVGAVGYYLLTGTPVFNGTTIMEICLKHVKDIPESPSKRIGKPINPELEALIMRCLAKAPKDRPKNAADLLIRIESLSLDSRWTSAEAMSWWKNLPSAIPTIDHPQSPVTPGPDATMAFEGN